jgi:hypothetical protein
MVITAVTVLSPGQPLGPDLGHRLPMIGKAAFGRGDASAGSADGRLTTEHGVPAAETAGARSVT